MKMMLPCREVTRLVSQGLDRRLGFGERVALRLHFAICEGCGTFERQMKLLRQGARQLAEADRPRETGPQST